MTWSIRSKACKYFDTFYFFEFIFIPREQDPFGRIFYVHNSTLDEKMSAEPDERVLNEIKKLGIDVNVILEVSFFLNQNFCSFVPSIIKNDQSITDQD